MSNVATSRNESKLKVRTGVTTPKLLMFYFSLLPSAFSLCFHVVGRDLQKKPVRIRKINRVRNLMILKLKCHTLCL